jgi:cyclopropane-fatty-acyl-phospholipid synthase
MTTVDRPRPTSRAARPSAVERAVVSVLDRMLVGLEGGSLAVTMPDGEVRRYGAGPEARLTIDDPRLFRRIARSPRFALGESYQAGEWRTDDLVGVLSLLMRNAAAARERHRTLRRFAELAPRVNRRNGILAARRNIAAHYDLGNELFALFLDETMTYSCAIFERPEEPLAEAQRRKLRRVCEKLELGPDDHVLEIGCGWGSFALMAAGDYGARVSAVTISRAQADLARRRVVEAGLADRIEIVERDFRELEGRYTKIASIEMLEAPGEKLWRPFFEVCDARLAEGGVACIQTILCPDERMARYRANPDWIERHVFPGSLIPSRAALRSAMSSTRLRVRDDEEIGHHYAPTLHRWRAAFLSRLERVRELGYDERFVRTWDFYLGSCEALFATGQFRDGQLVLAR